MYPMQCYPNQAMYCTPQAIPQVNAVKIDVNNPQAYGGMNSQGQMNPVIPQQAVVSPYACPCASMYAMLQVPQYTTPGAYPIPPVQQIAQTQMPAPVIANNSVPTAPQATPANTAAVIPMQTAPAPVQVMPVPVPVIPPVPAVPAAVPTVSAPVTQNVNVNPAIPAAITNNKQNTSVAPVAPVQQEVKLPGGVDVNTLIGALSSKNPDEQTAAIQKMAEIAQTDPVAARALLNEQTFGQLVNVINADTSKLQGPTGKPDPKNLSPLEKAEINKQFAVYTLAILQKNFRDEINKEMKKNNLPDIAINDLPYIKEGIVNNLKDNPNPTIREACLSALNYVGRPEDKEVLKTLYDISAKHDSNPAVQASAKDYLSKLPA